MMYLYEYVLMVAVFASASGSGAVPSVIFNNGKAMPALGLGTWLGFSKNGERVQVQGNEVEQAVMWAIDAGYRHIDTAYIYSTEEQVGKAINKKIADGAIKRDDVFVTTKLWNNEHARVAVIPALKKSLEKLGLDYVDLYLIHWPVSQNDDESLSEVDYLETWQGMVEAQAQGLTRSIGVSNFNEHQLQRILDNSTVAPQVLQVEINLNIQQPGLLSYCRAHNITVVGYSPFGSLLPSRAAADAPPPRVTDAPLANIASRHNKTVPQIVLRYLVELGVVPIPKSTNKSRIEQNLDVFDFHLTEENKAVLRGYDKNYRTIPVLHWKSSKFYPFEK